MTPAHPLPFEPEEALEAITHITGTGWDDTDLAYILIHRPTRAVLTGTRSYREARSEAQRYEAEDVLIAGLARATQDTKRAAEGDLTEAWLPHWVGVEGFTPHGLPALVDVLDDRGIGLAPYFRTDAAHTYCTMLAAHNRAHPDGVRLELVWDTGMLYARYPAHPGYRPPNGLLHGNVGPLLDGDTYWLPAPPPQHWQIWESRDRP